MSPSEIVNLHSEVELEKALRAELRWFGGEEAETATLIEHRAHCHTVKGLLADLQVERFVNSQRRVPDNKQSRSWHR